MDGRWMTVNSRLCHILGKNQEQLVQESFHDTAEHSEHRRNGLHRDRWNRKGSFGLEQRRVRQDGSELWVNWVVTLITNQMGCPEFFVAVAEDVSFRKWMERNLLCIRASIENSSEAIAMLDPEGLHTYHNFAFSALFGYDLEELAGVHRFDRLFAESSLAQDIHHRIARGQSWRGEAEMLTKGGRRFVAEIRFHAIHDESGQPVGWLAFHSDVSERKKLEQELHQAQKMEAIGRLAAKIAHDFNNFLSIIRWNSGSLLARIQNPLPMFRESINQITEACEQATRLTRQLLMYGRKQTIDLQIMDLNAFLGRTIHSILQTVGDSIEVQCAYSSDLPLARIDPGMLEQVLVNLAANARDAMPEGGRLRVATSTIRQRSPENSTLSGGEDICVRLTVEDSGTGIDPKNLPHIFEPFFTTKEIGKGTGLGLSIIDGIVRQHGGWVEVSSSLGKGTAFHVCLPAVRSAGKSTPLKAKRVSAQQR
jgi:PAS domain S-box-containing protein